jgi:murein DD-endopeptidase MepM/ murein hydrolase activator NlpD
MRFRISFLFTQALLLTMAQPLYATSEMTVVKELSQFRVIERALDRNHEQQHHQAIRREAAEGKAAGDQAEADARPNLQLPLRRGVSNSDPGFFGISNYVDQDDVMPDSLSDWNCGERTYDTETFNHNGTDYSPAQYAWLTMANDGLVVTAAADGTIVDRHDGEPDKQCFFDMTADSNTIVLEHDDGTVTIYAHMKTDTVTPRKVGDRVEQGDYLGVVGSSGLSTGPHLHLGVQTAANDIIDPYAGDCNLLNIDSWWEEQESYHEKDILAVATHSDFPEYPPCPQQEIPNFTNVFAPEDILYFSVTVRDFESTDTIAIKIRGPSGQEIYSTTRNEDSIEHAAAISLANGIQFGQPLADGEYRLSYTYAGQTAEHTFYVGNGPGPGPGAEASNNAFTGLWYDPSLEGEGFNIVTADGGTIVYFYGSDNRGNRLWLISDVISGVIEAGKSIRVLMYESTGGVFPTPVPSSRGLAAWGTLDITFAGCENGQASLNGVDGAKASQIEKLAGVAGASCSSGQVADSPWAGLWYDPGLGGEGYNLVVLSNGAILYFYGFNADGLRLWLISGLIAEALSPGDTVEVTMYESAQGTFQTPVSSDQALVAWGTANITVVDCDTITIVINGTDGNKTSNTVRLTGIIGLACE